MLGSKLVIDLETQKTFEDVGGRNYEDLLVSVLGVYRYDVGQSESYLENELHRFENMLIDSPLIIGFNIRKFDFPVLQRYMNIDTSKLPMLDILEDLTSKLGHRVSLESVARATLNIGKSADGLEAIEFFKKGEWEKLREYCLNDVHLTKEIYEYGVREGHVYYLTRDGTDRKSVKVEWNQFEPKIEERTDSQQYNLIF